MKNPLHFVRGLFIWGIVERQKKLTVENQTMKTRYKNHEIEILKNGNAVLNGITYNNLAIAIMEINWIYGIGNPEVTMQSKVAEL